MAAGCYREGSSGQIGLEQSSARDAEPRGKSLEEDVMIVSNAAEMSRRHKRRLADGSRQRPVCYIERQGEFLWNGV